MTLLFADGFQDCNVMQKPEWDILAVFAAVAGRDGTATSGARLGNNTENRQITLPTPAAVCIASVAFQTTTAAVYGNPNFSIMTFCRAGAPELSMTVNSSGFIEMRRYTNNSAHSTGTLLGTSSGHTPLAANVWRHFAAKVVLSDGTGGSFEVRIDDVVVLSVSGVATASAAGSVAAIRFAAATSSGTAQQWDDLVIMDAVDGTATDGRPNDNFPGDVKIATILPSAAGDSTQMTPSTGANYAAVDENPVNTTDYVSTSTSGHRDLYQHTDVPAAAILVLGIRQGLYAIKTDAGVASLKHVIKENGTVTVGSVKPLSTTYAGYWGNLIKLKPSNGAVFSVADANALQAGQELA